MGRKSNKERIVTGFLKEILSEKVCPDFTDSILKELHADGTIGEPINAESSNSESTNANLRILESFIEEIIAESKPAASELNDSNLDSNSEQILDSFVSELISSDTPRPMHVADLSVESSPETVPSVSRVVHRRKSSNSNYFALAFSVAALSIALVIAFQWMQESAPSSITDNGGPAAKNGKSINETPFGKSKPGSPKTKSDNPTEPNAKPPNGKEPNKNPPINKPSKNNNQGKDSPSPSFPQNPDFATDDGDGGLFKRELLTSIEIKSANEITTEINAGLKRLWDEFEQQPNEQVSLGKWCDRVVQALAGRNATDVERARLRNLGGSNQKLEFVETLFQDHNFLDEFSRNWADKFSTFMLGDLLKEKTVEDRFSSFIARALLENRSYDLVAKEIVEATGSAEPGPSFNAAVAFWLSISNHEFENATVQVGHVFLGQKVQCAQCHSHYVADLSQKDFWSMNASLRKIAVDRKNKSVSDSVQSGDAKDDGVVFEDLEGRMVYAMPAFDDKRLRQSEMNYREQLANEIIQSKRFRQQAVNWMVKSLTRYGFVQAGDLGPHNPPVDAELFDGLVDQFARHEYRIQDLVKWIVCSDLYSLSEAMNRNDSDKPEVNGVALFTRFYQDFEHPSATSKATITNALASVSDIYQDKRFDNLPSVRTKILGQRVGVANVEPIINKLQSKMMEQRIKAGWLAHGADYVLLDDIASNKQLSFDDAVDHLFLMAFRRKPNRKERKLCEEILARSKPKKFSREQVLQDIWIAISDH